MPQFIINGLHGTRCYRSNNNSLTGTSLIEWLKSEIEAVEGIPKHFFNLRFFSDVSNACLDNTIETHYLYIKLSIDGGKGGFGTLLRGGNANKHGPVNTDSSRDLDGRRLRDAAALQKIERAIQKKRAKMNGEEVPESESEDEQNAKKKRYKKRKAKPVKAEEEADNKEKEEEKYMLKQRKEEKIRQVHKLVVEETTEAVSEGLQRASQSSQPITSKSDHVILTYADVYDFGDSSSESDSQEEDDDEDSEEENMKPNETNNQIIDKTLSKSSLPSSSSSSSSNVKPEEVKSSEQAAKIMTDTDDGRNEPGLKRNHTQLEQESLIDLMKYDSIVALEALGLDRLKQELDARGLMVGGTLTQRAVRLWQVRGKKPEEYPKEILAKSKKSKTS